MFNYTEALEDLIRHIVANSSELGHVRVEQTVISYFRTRSPGTHGVYASCQPLRFQDGETTTVRRRRTYAMPRVFRAAPSRSGNLRLAYEYENNSGDQDDRTEILYIIYFALPRFMDLDFETKLTTVFHELYHISPEFNGDIRRFPGRKYAHGYSRKRFNEIVGTLVRAYMTVPGAEERMDFLRLDSRELVARYGDVIGTRVRPPRPKLVT